MSRNKIQWHEWKANKNVMLYHTEYNVSKKLLKICPRKIWSAVRLTNLKCERCFIFLSVLNAHPKLHSSLFPVCESEERKEENTQIIRII